MNVQTSDVSQNSKNQISFPEPLQPSGVLEQVAYEDITPVIGREFPHLNVVNDLLNSPNADTLIRDLAITSKTVQLFQFPILITQDSFARTQSRNVAWSSSAHKTT